MSKVIHDNAYPVLDIAGGWYKKGNRLIEAALHVTLERGGMPQVIDVTLQEATDGPVFKVALPRDGLRPFLNLVDDPASLIFRTEGSILYVSFPAHQLALELQKETAFFYVLKENNISCLDPMLLEKDGAVVGYSILISKQMSTQVLRDIGLEVASRDRLFCKIPLLNEIQISVKMAEEACMSRFRSVDMPQTLFSPSEIKGAQQPVSQAGEEKVWIPIGARDKAVRRQNELREVGIKVGRGTFIDDSNFYYVTVPLAVWNETALNGQSHETKSAKTYQSTPRKPKTDAAISGSLGSLLPN